MKRDPRFQDSLASVNKIASDIGGIANSNSSNNLSGMDGDVSGTGLANNNVDSAAVDSNDKFFSLGDDDESVMTPPMQNSPTKEGFQSVELGEIYRSTLGTRTLRGLKVWC